MYLFVIYHFIVYRHYITRRQNTFLFNMKCACMLKMEKNFIILISINIINEIHPKHKILIANTGHTCH